MRRCREAGGELTALVPGRSSGGRDRPRTAPASEAALRRVVHEVYLTPQKPTAAEVAREVAGRCRADKLRPPSSSTVRRRLRSLPLADRGKRGEEHPEAKPVHGHAPPVRFPLDLVQVDHTPIDLILVDPVDREPIGRPWLTVAIDVQSRCIAGFHVTLDAPSAASVGLCLTHVAMDKAPWLALREVEADWPVQGKPRRIGVDNGAEFHSEAFKRGCEQHGIGIDWRPPGRPQFGGAVERVIGTLMGLVHGLPGTTFSNIGQAPLRRWREGVVALAAEGSSIPVPRDLRAYLVDFLPVLRRSLQRDGLTIDHVTYFSSALRAWITARNRPGPLLVRRDPRDLSRVFVLDPLDGGYLEVPTRDLSRPAISLWEHRLARRRLRAKHRGEINEAALFGAIEEMRAAERDAARLTRSARRDRTRRARAPDLPAAPPSAEPANLAPVTEDAAVAYAVETELPRPFDDIEQW